MNPSEARFPIASGLSQWPEDAHKVRDICFSDTVGFSYLAVRLFLFVAW